MALYKEITLGNGITVNYHRVVSVNIITNVQNIIEVASYTSKEKREEEKTAIETGGDSNVFIETTYLNADYDQTMSIVSAYDYLKTLPEYEDATDVMD